MQPVSALCCAGILGILLCRESNSKFQAYIAGQKYALQSQYVIRSSKMLSKALGWIIVGASMLSAAKGAEVTGLSTSGSSACSQIATCAASNSSILNNLLSTSSPADEVRIPAGNYPISPLSISRDATLTGSGKGLTTLTVYGSGTTSISVSAGSSSRVTVSLSGLTLAGAANGSFVGIAVKDGNDITIKDVIIANPSVGIALRGNNLATRIEDVTVDLPAQGGILFGDYPAGTVVNTTQSNIDTYLSNIQIVGDHKSGQQGIPQCQYGILIYSGASGVYGNHVSAVGCGIGYVLDIYANVSAATIIPEWIFCTTCLADTSAGNGWEIRHGRGVTLNGSWAGNNGSSGLYANEVYGLVLNSFKSYNNFNAGITLDSKSQEVVVSSSHISQNNRANSGCASGIYVASGARKILLTGNIVSSAPLVDPTGSSQMKCGIEVRDGASVAQAKAAGNLISNIQIPSCEPAASYSLICPFDSP
jgi:hypothetical protein